jgi:SAM-dependent methyltransferase
MSDLDRQRQDLIECATLARTIAPRTCRIDPETGERCDWYHGFWPYLRLLDVVGSPFRHARFFRTALAPLIETGDYGRVLVSGAVDYVMPAVAIDIYRGLGAPLDLTVIDVCETPLALCRWFAERRGVPLAAIASDILDYDRPESCDVICTHSFLGMFAPEPRRALVRRWHRLLRPGGVVATLVRLRPGAGADRVGFTAGEAEAFVAALVRKAEAVPLDLDRATLTSAGRAYVARQRPWRLRGIDEIDSLFRDAGFALDLLRQDDSERPSAGPASGPTARGGSYALIVARRP